MFNVDLPIDPEAYVHRVGRTGRAGREGTAFSLVDPRQRGLLTRIERYAKRAIPVEELPTVDEVEAARAARLAAAVSRNLDGATDRDRSLVVELIAAGEDPMRIAAAALAVAREARHEAPLAPIAEVRDHRSSRPAPHDRQRGGQRAAHHGGPRDEKEAGYVRLALDAGRDAGVLPGQVVSALARTADIPGKALGKILIHDRQTLVDVPENLVDQVLQSGEYRFGKRLARVDVA